MCLEGSFFPFGLVGAGIHGFGVRIPEVKMYIFLRRFSVPAAFPETAHNPRTTE